MTVGAAWATNQLHQLKAALADRYTIEQELGRDYGARL
jgi:hypothetical protein